MSKLTLTNDKKFLTLICSYDQRHIPKKIGGRWNPSMKSWDFAIDLTLYSEIQKAFGNSLEITDQARQVIQNKIIQDNTIKKFKEQAKKNQDINYSVPGLLFNGKNPLFDYQKHGVRCGTVAQGGFLIADQMGLGKAQVVDNKLFTPLGRKRIGDIVVGDKVIGRDGDAHNVIGVYPQGMKHVYKITFNDGCSIECADEHLWTVFNGNETKTLMTKEIKELCYTNFQIPIVKPIQFSNDYELPIEPYLMGVLIANGNYIDNNDFDEIYGKYIENNYCGAKQIVKGLSSLRMVAFDNIEKQISELKLNVHASERFIPDSYKYTSIKDRLKLLYGLMDSDGFCTPCHTEFKTASEKLADDMVELIQSLGGIAVKYFIDDFYHIDIKMPQPFNPFRLSRKHDAYHFVLKHEISRYIKDISYVGEKECICIAVDSDDHLYVTQHCIVTHNTIQGLGIALNKKILSHARQCLIVCPACMKYGWLNQIQKFTKEKALVIDGKVQQRYQKWFATGYYFKIVNYEILVRDLFYVQKTDKLGNVTSKDNRIPDCQQLIDNYFQVMVIDQAHYLSSTNALRTLACKGMKVKTKIALTGTPVNGRLSQMYSIMQVIKPGLFPTRAKFLQRYAIFDHFGGVKQWVRIDQFKNKIQPYYIRRLKNDVLKSLPPMIIQTMYAQFSDKAAKQYKKLVKGDCDLTFNDQMLVRIIRARQFCNCPSILGKQYQKISKDKLSVFKDLCTELIKQNGHKIVVFSQYRETVNVLLQELQKQKYQVVLLKSFKNKFQGAQYFNNSKTANVFLCTDQGMTGLNLGSAQYLINYDVSWSPAVNLQRYARIHRANTKHTANIINLVVKDTIQERILQAIQDKLVLSDNVLDQNFTDAVITQPISTRDLYNML